MCFFFYFRIVSRSKHNNTHAHKKKSNSAHSSVFYYKIEINLRSVFEEKHFINMTFSSVLIEIRTVFSSRLNALVETQSSDVLFSILLCHCFLL